MRQTEQKDNIWASVLRGETWNQHLARAPSFKADVSRVLKVSNEYFTAGAIFERVSGVWRCREAESAISWMKTMDVRSVKTELLRRGCSWEWI